MGQVLLVEKGEPPFVTRFALKLVRSVGDDDDAKRLFLAETQVLSGLAHRNVVRAIDFGEHDGTCYLVMEYVEGVSLRELLRARRLPTSLVVHIAIELSRGLSYCHDFARHRHLAEIVHRDVKPENILLALADGSVKIGDFGIAKFAGRADQTATDVMRGTPLYMSPEHIDASRTLDQRSDLFSFGIVLYEMLTGQNPYREHPSENAKVPSNVGHVLGKILLNQPIKPLSELAPYLDPELVELVHGLLAHNKQDRPQSAQAVLAVLSRLPLRADANERLIEYIEDARRELGGQRSSATPRPITAAAPNSKASTTLLGSSPVAAPEGFAKPDLMPRMLTDEEEDLLEESSHFVAPVRSDFGDDSVMSLMGQTPALAATRPDRTAATPRGTRRARQVVMATAIVLAFGLTAAAITLNTRSTAPSATPAAVALAARSKQQPPQQPYVELALPPYGGLTPPPAEVADASTHEGDPGLAPTLPALATPLPALEPSDNPAPSRPRAEVAPKLADLRVVVYEWGWIWVDDVLRGESPVTLTGLKPGMHNVGYGQNHDAPTHTKKVRLHAGTNKLSYDQR